MDRPPSYMLECLARVSELRPSEVHHVTSFRADRIRKDGTAQTVDIEILDAGSTLGPKLRFSCVARGDDGRVATGNPAETVDLAIDLVHWIELDAES